MKCVSSTHRDGTADKCTTFVCLLHFLQKKKQTHHLVQLFHLSLIVPRLLCVCHLQYKIYTEFYETGCLNFIQQATNTTRPGNETGFV